MSNFNLRSSIFRHLNGLAVAPVVSALNNKKVLDHILSQKEVSLQEGTDRKIPSR